LFDGLHYVETLVGKLNPPIPRTRDKETHRGFNNLTIARLLCPVSYITEFDADPEAYVSLPIDLTFISSFSSHRFRNRVRIGSLQVLNQDFPLFLYNEAEINPDDPAAGLFKSELLVAVSVKHHKGYYGVNVYL
jgi:hypothetical protein